MDELTAERFGPVHTLPRRELDAYEVIAERRRILLGEESPVARAHRRQTRLARALAREAC